MKHKLSIKIYPVFTCPKTNYTNIRIECLLGKFILQNNTSESEAI
jgi:hypothetical protein